jgi:hypothetical protein
VALRPTLSDGLPLSSLLLYRTLFVRTLKKNQVSHQNYDFTFPQKADKKKFSRPAALY